MLVGEAAMEAAASDPAATFYSVKRLLGRPFSQVQSLISGLAYEVGCCQNSTTFYTCRFRYLILPL